MSAKEPKQDRQNRPWSPISEGSAMLNLRMNEKDHPLNISAYFGSACSSNFIKYIYYWNIQFLNNVMINKTQILPPQK
jgi:hypothetical protein